LPQLATSGLQYRESGSPIVQQISRYGDTPKYADMVDRDIGDIYRHMSTAIALFPSSRFKTLLKTLVKELLSGLLAETSSFLRKKKTQKLYFETVQQVK